MKDEKITILRGVVVNILKYDGIDLENNILKKFDVVGAAVHSYFSLPKGTNKNADITNVQS